MEQAKKILIIEDEKILGEILLSKLRAEGYDAFWELDGEAGLHKIHEIRPDLVLLDIVMPKKDGYEVLEEMMRDEALKQIPVVIISNSGQPVEIENIIKLGAKDYIIKAQFGPEEVLEKVRKYIGGGVRAEVKDQKKISGVKIMLIEDDAFLSSLASGRLEKEGFQVSTVTDGVQAFKLLESDIPDLILLDIILPGMSGFEVLKKIKADPKYEGISVIIFSNLGQDHEITEARELGADDFLIKAKFTLKEVVDKIYVILKKKGKI